MFLSEVWTWFRFLDTAQQRLGNCGWKWCFVFFCSAHCASPPFSFPLEASANVHTPRTGSSNTICSCYLLSAHLARAACVVVVVHWQRRLPVVSLFLVCTTGVRGKHTPKQYEELLCDVFLCYTVSLYTLPFFAGESRPVFYTKLRLTVNHR